MQSEHTAGQAQFVEGTFVLTKEHCSTAVVLQEYWAKVNSQVL
jgi:hypothetical protein